MDTFDNYVLIIIIMMPLLGAAALVAIPSCRLSAIRWFALVVSSIVMLLTFYTFIEYDHQGGGIQFAQTWQWLEMPGLWPLGDQGISLALGLDGLSVPLMMLAGIVMFTGVLMSWNIEERAKDFFVLYFLLLAGVFGVFATLDMFFFFFFYELAVLPMYLLIGVWGSSSDFRTFIRTKEYGAMKLMLYLVAGSVLVWISILAIFVEAGLGTFSILELEKVALSDEFQRIFFPMLAVGFGVLAGLWPFHTWSPDGHVAAPTPVSMVHAGVLMKLGAFGIIRLGMQIMPIGADEWMPVLLGLGTVNVIYGAWSAMGQTDLKYVVGYSSVSHMGYVLIGIASLNSFGISGAVLQMFSHGIMTALFFASVGVIYHATHTRDVTMLQGMAKPMGTTAVFFAVAGLTSLGLPGLSGFVAELLVFIGLFQTYPIVGVLAVIGAAMTAVYILRLIRKIFFGPLSDKWRDVRDSSRIENVSGWLLVGFILLVGLFPFPFMEVINVGVTELLLHFPGVR